MAGLNKANVAWSSLLLKVVDVIRNEWQPSKLSSELQYRNSLAAFLREVGGPDAHVETEYRHAGTTTDIYLKWDGIFRSDGVFIELKYNLRQKTEYDRLVGQIEQINPAKRNLIVVLCGDHHDENLIARLRDRYKVFDLPYPSSPRIVIKKCAEGSESDIQLKKNRPRRKRQSPVLATTKANLPMNLYEAFRHGILKKVNADRAVHFKVGVLTNEYGIPESHICEQLERMAAAHLIGLAAWDGQRERPFHQWHDADSFFYNRTDRGHVRIRLLSAGAELLAQLPRIQSASLLRAKSSGSLISRH